MTTDLETIVDGALEALGGDDTTEFYVTATMEDEIHGGSRPKISVNCCFSDCEWGYTIGQMPVWEIVTDCRMHWEEKHCG